MNVEDSDLFRVFRVPTERAVIRSVWLYQNKFTKLVKENFGEYIMANIYLDVNEISSIASGAFGKASSTLKDVSLSRNQLSTFPWGDLKLMSKLKRFSLSFNRIQEIPEKAFAQCSTIEMLELRSNEIKQIGPYAFEALESVQLIDLSVNQLSYLSSNSMKIRSRNPQEVSLLLRNNSISSVAIDAFSEDNGPGFIDLSNNRLIYLDEVPFRNLITSNTILNLDNNPFDCRGCLLYEWVVNLNDKQKSNIQNFRCLDGTELRNLTLKKIGCKEETNQTNNYQLETILKTKLGHKPIVRIE